MSSWPLFGGSSLTLLAAVWVAKIQIPTFTPFYPFSSSVSASPTKSAELSALSRQSDVVSKPGVARLVIHSLDVCSPYIGLASSPFTAWCTIVFCEELAFGCHQSWTELRGSNKDLHLIVWPAGIAKIGCKMTKNQCLSIWKGVINSYYYNLIWFKSLVKKKINGKVTGNSVGAKCLKTPDELFTNQLVTSGWLFCLVPSNRAQRWFCLHLLALAPVVKHLGRIRS